MVSLNSKYSHNDYLPPEVKNTSSSFPFKGSIADWNCRNIVGTLPFGNIKNVQKIIRQTYWRMAAPFFPDFLRCSIAYVDWPSASVHVQSSSASADRLKLEKSPAQLYLIISLTFLSSL